MKEVARLFSTIVVFILATFLFGNNALAFKAEGSASIVLVPPTEINQTKALNFKGIDLPRDGESDVVIDSYRGVSGGSASMGEYRLSTSGKNSVQIDVKNASDDAQGIKVSKFKGNFNGREVSFPTKNQPTSNGQANLKLGATLTVASDAQVGNHNKAIVIAFNYE